MTAPGGVVLVVTSPRTPPGLLSWPAWQALRAAPVGVGDEAHPQVPFLRDAGVEVVPTPRPEAPAGLRTGYGGDAAPGDVALAQALHARAVAGEQVVWLADGEADAGLVRALGDLAARERRVALEVVYGSYDLPGSHLLDVVAVMDRLRSPGGCPWDAEQTHASLKKHLLEEAYEAYEALEQDDLDGLREELGDVLLQVVFHARLAQEAERPWSVDDVADGLVAKLVRRHPHVFAGAPADDLEGSWERVKAAEGRTSPWRGVPLGQPALALAAALQRRAARAGAPVPSAREAGGRPGRRALGPRAARSGRRARPRGGAARGVAGVPRPARGRRPGRIDGMTRAAALLLCLLPLAACSGGGSDTPSAGPPRPPPRRPRRAGARPSLVLRGDGLTLVQRDQQTPLPFGTGTAVVVPALAAPSDEPAQQTVECGQGGRTDLGADGFDVLFDGEHFVGWDESGGTHALMTEKGLTLGLDRAR